MHEFKLTAVQVWQSITRTDSVSAAVSRSQIKVVIRF